ncbi:MAG: hypothetical protein OEZ25_08920 [Candidatus Bathyarchaeota archaeon]|nr:hypothetical protein [Candidatus Bathyarchaeota archaeon]
MSQGPFPTPLWNYGTVCGEVQEGCKIEGVELQKWARSLFADLLMGCGDMEMPPRELERTVRRRVTIAMYNKAENSARFGGIIAQLSHQVN